MPSTIIFAPTPLFVFKEIFPVPTALILTLLLVPVSILILPPVPLESVDNNRFPVPLEVILASALLSPTLKVSAFTCTSPVPLGANTILPLVSVLLIVLVSILILSIFNTPLILKLVPSNVALVSALIPTVEPILVNILLSPLFAIVGNSPLTAELKSVSDPSPFRY